MTRTAMIPRPVEATLQVVLTTGETITDPTDADLAAFNLTDAGVVDVVKGALSAATVDTLRPVLSVFDAALRGRPLPDGDVTAANDVARDARVAVAQSLAGHDAPVTVNEAFGEDPEERERLFAVLPPKVVWAVLEHYLADCAKADAPPLTVLRARRDHLDRQVRPWEYQSAGDAA